ncbi:PucR family transcriptional regulator [Demetria terragena]|uniref:PucR family transcriptional regulator n=1 Tax=Demetria terragena TaxID=63959 RepID=UPI000367F437|nr:helix-turn-helix domain-containing protein [Demetria terragena]
MPGLPPGALSPRSWPDPTPVTRELTERLLPRAEELGVVLRDALLEKSAAYLGTDLVPPDELMRSCRDNMVRSLQTLSGQIPTDSDPFDAAYATARGRAEAGFPLEDLLQAYRIGAEVIWSAILAESRQRVPDSIDDLLDSAAQVMHLIDLMSVAAADAYRTRELELKRRHTERRQAILDGLLEGRAADPEFAAEAVQVLGLSDQARLVIVVVRHLEAHSHPPDSPADGLALSGLASEWRLRADHEVGLVTLNDAPMSLLLKRLRASVKGWVGVSDPFVGLADIATEFRMAQMVLASLPEETPTVATFADRLPEVLITGNRPVAVRIRERAFGPLLGLPADKRDPLLETIDRWFKNNRSTSDTAAEMHCHRNTIVYRLNRIEELTGCRLDNARDQLLLRLALMVR